MKKIIQWLTGGVIKEVGDVIDKLTTTKEEKLDARKINSRNFRESRQRCTASG